MAEEKKKAIHPEIRALSYLAVAILWLISLFTFEQHHLAANAIGILGGYLAKISFWSFGILAFPAAAMLFWLGWRELGSKPWSALSLRIIAFCGCVLGLSLLLTQIGEHFTLPATLLSPYTYGEELIFETPYPHLEKRVYLGGVPAFYLMYDCPYNLHSLLGEAGLFVFSAILSLGSMLIMTDWRLKPALDKGIGMAKIAPRKGFSLFSRIARAIQAKRAEKSVDALFESRPSQTFEIAKIEQVFLESSSKNLAKPYKERKATIQTLSKTRAVPLTSGFQIPPPTLLNTPKKVDQPTFKKELRQQADILEESLMSFGIEAKVGEIHSGPTITSFEVHPAVGVKVQKIKALENDIALNLQAKSIRILAPIPGKAVVGVEVPSLYPQEVSFREILQNYQSGPKKMQIPVLLGKTVSGEFLMSDLAKMPHCIIAGATGSGKSVCINTIIMSILMNASPDEIKLLMIDPKKVELSAYSELPHMIAPVITEAHGAYAALQWLVKEMQNRYEILKQLGFRNITAFNNRTPDKELEATLTMEIPEKMYNIVAIIDEFADLMMASSSDLETPIARIAQMARAVGIHLILATQRPSREVITGLIKANFPTRIAFKVASRINSQIIIDEIGAESLLGNGDMLFLPPGSAQLMRAQGAYISDEEIHRVIDFICRQARPNYLIASFDSMRKEDMMDVGIESGPKDQLFEEALKIVVETKTASTTYLQRKLKIGYARAASLMDELEQKGVISAQEGSKPRRVLSSASSHLKQLADKEGMSYGSTFSKEETDY